MTTSIWLSHKTSTKPLSGLGYGGMTSPLNLPEPRSSAQKEILQPQGWWAIAMLAKRFVIFLVGLVIILATIEGALTWQAKSHPPPRKFIPKYPTPYVEFYSEAMYDGDGIATNEAGFRYGNLPLKKPAGEMRIFMLSSSLGFTGKTNETTIPGYLEAMLADNPHSSKQKVRVINAASMALVTRQSLVLLVTKILDYEPDAIIIFHGPETLFYAIHEDQRLGYPYTFALRESQNRKLKQYLDHLNPFLTTLADMRWVQKFQPDLAKTWGHQQLATITRPKPLLDMQPLSPHIEGIANDMGKMIQIAAKFDCRTMIAMPPWHARDMVKKAIPALVKSVSSKCQSENVAEAFFVDTRDWEQALTSQQTWLPDGIHWNDKGNKIIARKFVTALRENNFVD